MNPHGTTWESQGRSANIDDLISPGPNRVNCIKRRSKVSSGPLTTGLQGPQDVHNLHLLGGQREGGGGGGGEVAEVEELVQDDRHQAKERGGRAKAKDEVRVSSGRREIDPTCEIKTCFLFSFAVPTLGSFLLFRSK